MVYSDGNLPAFWSFRGGFYFGVLRRFEGGGTNFFRNVGKIYQTAYHGGSRGSVVSLATKLWAGLSELRIPIGTGSGAHPVSYSMRTGVPSWGLSDGGVKLSTHLHLVSRLVMNGAMPLLPLYGVDKEKPYRYLFFVEKGPAVEATDAPQP